MTVSRTAQPLTPFARMCAERGLLSPSAFLPVFAETAIGRQFQLAAGQTAEHCGWLCFEAVASTTPGGSGARRSPPPPSCTTNR
jgi:hypothetical protein